MDSYSYNCTDKSIFLPYFKQYYVRLYFKLIPHAVTANYITLISTGFICAILVIALCSETVNTGIIPLIFALCVHNYVVGDHLDGMQAKNTNTSSPLGEYLDHYLDVFNGAIIIYALTVFFAPIPDSIFYCFLVLNSLSFAITMVEELECNQLIFGLIGTLEGLIILILFFVTWMIEPVRQFWEAELIPGYPRFWLVIIIFALGYLATLVDVIRRIGFIPRQFLLFCAINLLLAFGLYRIQMGHLQGWIIISLFNGEYISKVMESYLIRKKHKYPDLFVAALAVSVTIIQLLSSGDRELLINLSTILTVYLAGKVCFLFALVIYQLRKHWLWRNP